MFDKETHYFCVRLPPGLGVNQSSKWVPECLEKADMLN